MTEPIVGGSYPGYDVMSKRDTPSWNDKTRAVIDARLAVEARSLFFSAEEWRTLEALCDRVVPQPVGKARVPLGAYVDRQLLAGKTKGYRFEGMPQPAEAWRRGLAALEEAALRAQGRPFAHLTQADQDDLLRQMADGSLQAQALRDMPAKTFWNSHVIHDVAGAYYAHPQAWNDIGWGGPASPRGYVRLGLNHRDPWEPEEAAPNDRSRVTRENRHVR
jgi:hypothetical protein